MTQEEILEFNKRCAEFLGAYFCNDDLNAYPNGYWMINNDEIDLPYNLKDMGFHSDWNWIMEVVEAIIEKYNESHYITSKINYSLSKNCLNKNYRCEISIDDRFMKKITIYTENLDSKKAVVQAIYEFLKWYKEQTL